LVVTYGRLNAVDGVDLQVRAGEVVAVLGRNGAGKTSTVEALEGYRPAASGTIRVLGLDPQRPDGHRQLTRRAGVMLQRGGVYPAMSPAEAVKLFSKYYDDPEEPEALIDRLGLQPVAQTLWRRLSGGEQQRVSLALALVGRPEVVFLDEPTAGVDVQGRAAIRNELARLRDRQVAVLLTTHELEEAERVADRIVIIERGRVVASGTADELTASRPEQAQLVRFAAQPGLDTADLGRALGADVREEKTGRYVVGAPGSPRNIAVLTAWMADHEVVVTELQTGRERLEDVFLRLTSGGEP
jgi:ABC-2 type transport system ATP-binding protein